MPGQLVLQDDRTAAPVAAPWAGPLLALGARLYRHARPAANSRLVVALTVPIRDVAAVLLATGWVLTRPIATPPLPEELLTTLQAGTPVKIVAGKLLVADRFYGYDIGRRKLHIGGSGWLLDKIDCLLPEPDLPATRFRRSSLTSPGSLVTSAGGDKTWLVAQAASGSDVVLVGTKSQLDAEMTIRPGRANMDLGHNSFGEVLRPDDGSTPAWASAVLPAARFEEAVFPPAARLTVLDGKSAIGWLNDLTTDVCVAIVDRSLEDDFASESIIQLRSMGGTPVPLDRFGWRPPPGVEALAFEVRR